MKHDMQCCDPVIDSRIGALIAECERLRAALATLVNGWGLLGPQEYDARVAEARKLLLTVNQQATAPADDHPLLQMGEDLRPTTVKRR